VGLLAKTTENAGGALVQAHEFSPKGPSRKCFSPATNFGARSSRCARIEYANRQVGAIVRGDASLGGAQPFRRRNLCETRD
jgi:hypothetical protein